MDDDKKTIEQIERYLDGSLPPKEKKDFERRLKNDKKLAAMFQLNNEVNYSLQDDKALEMEGLLKGMGEEFANGYQAPEPAVRPQQAKVPRIRRITWMALSAAVLTGILLFWQFSPSLSNSSNPGQLYAAHYETYPATNAIRSVESTPDTPLHNALRQYADADYQNAAAAFTQILEVGEFEDGEQALAGFYKGLALVESGQTAEAEQQLKATLSLPPHPYTQQTQWYLALIALKKGETDTARQYLNDALSTSAQGKYAKKAKALLEELGE